MQTEKYKGFSIRTWKVNPALHNGEIRDANYEAIPLPLEARGAYPNRDDLIGILKSVIDMREIALPDSFLWPSPAPDEPPAKKLTAMIEDSADMLKELAIYIESALEIFPYILQALKELEEDKPLEHKENENSNA